MISLALAGASVAGLTLLQSSSLPCVPVPFEQERAIPACAEVNSSGQPSVRPEALARLDFADGDIAAVSIEGLLYYVSKAGRTIPALPFDNGVDYFVEGRARTYWQGKVGYVDTGLREVIPPAWDFAFPFREGVARVCDGCKRITEGEHQRVVGGLWGYINLDGDVVIPAQYTEADLPEPPLREGSP